MDNTPQKQCTKSDCRKWYPATTEYFSRDKNRKDGLFPQCKFCRKAYHKARGKLPGVQESHKVYLQSYYNNPENREHHRAYNKAYYSQSEHRESQKVYNKAYHQAHKQDDHYRQQRSAYQRREDVRERQNTLRRCYYRQPENNEQRKVYHKAYRKQHYNAEKNRSYVETRRARRQSVRGRHTAQQVQNLLNRQKYKCYYCAARFERIKGKYIYHVDHTFPLSRVAGSDIPANDISYLVLACPACNLSKGDRFPWEFEKGGKLL